MTNKRNPAVWAAIAALLLASCAPAVDPEKVEPTMQLNAGQKAFLYRYYVAGSVVSRCARYAPNTAEIAKQRSRVFTPEQLKRLDQPTLDAFYISDSFEDRFDARVVEVLRARTLAEDATRTEDVACEIGDLETRNRTAVGRMLDARR